MYKYQKGVFFLNNRRKYCFESPHNDDDHGHRLFSLDGML